MNDFEAILQYSQAYPFEPNSTNLLTAWREAKAPFIKLFGDKTIWRSKEPIKVILDSKERARRFNSFLSSLDEEELLKTNNFDYFLVMNEDGFFDNRVVKPYPSLNITPGTKLLKAFKNFFPQEDSLRKAQDIASRYIQENKIEGYLYLSVDPIDFLTLSETNENWRSCHSLDGDYRAGNLSYMVDNTTFIAYLSNGTPQSLKALPADIKWTSKKWRMLLHMVPNKIIYYDKQYPFSSDNLVEKVWEAINSLSNRGYFYPRTNGFRIIQQHENSFYLPRNQIILDNRVYDTSDIIDVSDYKGYPDLLESTTYIPVTSFCGPMEHEYPKAKIKIGKKAPCCSCGNAFIDQDNSFLCSECRGKYGEEDFYLKCTDCGHRLWSDDETYYIGDEPYCKSCYIELKEDPNG